MTPPPNTRIFLAALGFGAVFVAGAFAIPARLRNAIARRVQARPVSGAAR